MAGFRIQIHPSRKLFSLGIFPFNPDFTDCPGLFGVPVWDGDNLQIFTTGNGFIAGLHIEVQGTDCREISPGDDTP
jgi:hypothetical protein